METQKIEELVAAAKAYEFSANSWLDCENDWDVAQFHWINASKTWLLAITEFLKILNSDSEKS